jgi:hypothetical protein
MWGLNKMVGMSGFIAVRGRRWSSGHLRLAGLAVAITVASACAGSLAGGSPTGPRTTSDPAGGTAPSTMGAGPTWTLAPWTAPPESPSPPSTATPLPSGTPEQLRTVPTPPAGLWKSIHWYAGPTLVSCPEPDPNATEDPNGAEPPECPTLRVFGWSKGFVAFADTEKTIAVWSSADGLKWVKRHNLNLGGQDYVQVSYVLEGPAGLLAIGYSSARGMCSSPDLTIHALWISADGATWSPISMARFDGSPTTIASSSMGYIATGGYGEPEVWISKDGRTWNRATLPFTIYRNASVDGPTAFAGGFLIYGEVISPGGCGGDYLETSTVWFSATGTSGWVREVLPGAVPATNVSTSVALINDSTLLATSDTLDDQGNIASESRWTSTDAQTWKAFSLPALEDKSWSLLSGGSRTLAQIWPAQSTADPTGEAPAVPPTWMIFDQNLVPNPLSEKGDIPASDYDSDYAVGPTGIVFCDGSQVWIGVAEA